MSSFCRRDDWEEAAVVLPGPLRNRLLTSRNSMLQILCIVLAVVVVVFALLAVFLCAKWKLAVRGARRDASDGFYVRTFHTKQHRYRPDDDDPYGFPTMPRDSTFHGDVSTMNGQRVSSRSATNGAAQVSNGGRSSFVNGGFYEDTADGLPPPPPELRACLIDDTHFTDVPLHNLGSDSLGRAHRGVRGSPPAPPVRTISSGYNTTSGQSTPSSPCPLSPITPPEYHRPHEVLTMMPPIPKADYSDSDDDSTDRRKAQEASREDHPTDEQPKNRFTVRTAL